MNVSTVDGSPNWRGKPYAERMAIISKWTVARLERGWGISKFALTPQNNGGKCYCLKALGRHVSICPLSGR
jgi:uncharacterized FlgJ-related protein